MWSEATTEYACLALDGLERKRLGRRARALVENRTLVTADKRLLDYPILSVDARA